MTENDYKAFCEVVVGFAELRGKQLSAAALKLYWRAMRGWSLDEFRQAAEHLLRTCEFMPTPKNFEDLRKAGRPDAAEAWEQARCFASALWHPLGYRNGSIGDRAIDLAVGALGGYPAIAMCDTDKLQWLEKRFREAFEDTSEKHSVREALPQITAPVNHGAHTPLRAPTHIGGVLTHLERPGEQPQASRPTAPVSLAPPQPPITVNSRDKITKLAALQMSDEDVAKCSGESIELVREVLAGETTEVEA